MAMTKQQVKLIRDTWDQVLDGAGGQSPATLAAMKDLHRAILAFSRLTPQPPLEEFVMMASTGYQSEITLQAAEKALEALDEQQTKQN